MPKNKSYITDENKDYINEDEIIDDPENFADFEDGEPVENSEPNPVENSKEPKLEQPKEKEKNTYEQGWARIHGAEKYFAKTEDNQAYINGFFGGGQGGAYSSNQEFLPIIPSDFNRLYFFDKETGRMIKESVPPEIEAEFADHPEKFYEFLDSKDLKKYGSGDYYIFPAGAKIPNRITGNSSKTLTQEELFAETPLSIALKEGPMRERANMDEKALEKEKELRTAQSGVYEKRRVMYLAQSLFGSFPYANQGNEKTRDFAQKINFELESDKSGEKFDYDIKNNRLTEDDMIAMTMLSLGKVRITGDTYPSSNKLANSAGCVGMWAYDLFIERSGKTTEMLDWLKNARRDAKKCIEEYDKTGNTQILADAVIEGLIANVNNIKNADELSAAFVGNGATAILLNRFVRKPNIKAAVLARAEELGVSDQIKEAMESLNNSVAMIELTNEKNENDITAEAYNSGKLTEDTPEQTQEFKDYYNNEKKISDTLFKLTDYVLKENKKMEWINTPETQKVADLFERRTAEAANDPNTMAQKMNEASDDWGTSQQFANKERPVPGFVRLLGQPGGKKAILEIIEKNEGLEISELYNKVEESGLIPKMPHVTNEKPTEKEQAEAMETAVKGYWARLKNYDPAQLLKDLNEGIVRQSYPKDDINVQNNGKMAPDSEAIYELKALETGLEGIKFDKKYVDETIGMIEVSQANPDEKELAETYRKLVITDAVAQAHCAVYAKEHPGDDAGVQKLRTSIRNHPEKYSDAKSLMEYSGDNYETLLRNYQQTALACNNEKELEYFVLNYVKNENPKTQGLKAYSEYGNAYIKGLFALKPDRSGMRFKDMNVKGGTETLEKWQDEIEKVELEIPEDMSDKLSPRLMEFAVMGDCLLEENLLKTKDMAYGFGSTIPEGFNVHSALETFFFENTLDDDSRMNTHAIRSIVADSRKNIKNYVETKDYDKLYASLGQAAASLYSQAISGRDISQKSNGFGIKAFTDLVNAAKEKDISLEKIGISEKMLKNMDALKKKYDLQIKLLDNEKELSRNLLSANISGGRDEKSDILSNPKLYDAYVEGLAIKQIQKQIEGETSKINEQADICSEHKEEILINRDLTFTEKLLGENPEALIEYYKQNITKQRGYESLLKASPEERAGMLRNGISQGGYKTSASWDPVTFEKLIADDLLGSIIEKSTEYYNTREKVLAEELKKNKKLVEEELKENKITQKEADQKIKDVISNYNTTFDGIAKMIKVAKEIKVARTEMPDPSSKKGMDKLKPLYEKLNRAIENARFVNEITGDYGEFFFNVSLQLNSVEEHIKSIDKAPEVKAQQQEFAKEIAEVAAESKTNLENNADLHVAALEYYAGGKQKDPDLAAFINDFNNTRLSVKEAMASKLDGRKRVKKIKEHYDKLLESTEKCLNSKKLGDKLKFVIKGIKTSLKKDKDILEKIEEKPGKTFSENFAEARIKKDNGVLQKSRFELDRLGDILERTGNKAFGNSDEFNELMDSMKAIKSVDPDNFKLYKDQVNIIQKKARAYVSAKPYVPKTDKGKVRLETAKEILDTCSSMKQVLSHEMKAQEKERALQKEKPLTVLTKRIDQCKKNIIDAVQGKNSTKLLTGISELIYMQDLSEQASQLGEEKLAEYLKPERVSQAVGKLNQLTSKVLPDIKISDFKKAIKDKNLSEFVKKSFNEYVANPIKKEITAQKSADKSDDILTKANTKKTVGNISL